MRAAIFLSFALAACTVDATVPTTAQPAKTEAARPSLADVRSWAYVIQKQTEGDRIERLAKSSYDLVVIDDPRSFSDTTSYDARADVARLHATKKIVLAYVDIGEAEDYRAYWKKEWSTTKPSFVVADDPDGWAGNYPVAYWTPEWRAIVDGAVDAIVEDGYDGIYMDWVEAALFDPIRERAAAEGTDARDEMVKLVAHIKERGRAKNPSFFVVAQNAIGMRKTKGWLALLDGEAQEQISFDGAADVYGDDPRQGDCRLPARSGDSPPASNPSWCNDIATMGASTEEYVSALRDYKRAGIPVFVVDYALEPAHAREAYALDAQEGFVGLVTMRSLEDLTRTPPR